MVVIVKSYQVWRVGLIPVFLPIVDLVAVVVSVVLLLMMSLLGDVESNAIVVAIILRLSKLLL